MLSHVGALESVQCVSTKFVSHGESLHTLKVGHVGPDIRVQGVDNHLPVGWSSNLNSAVDKTWRWRCGSPCVIVTDVLGLWQKVELAALVKLQLANLASLKKSLACGVEGAVEEGEEGGCILGEDLAGLVIERSEDLDVRENLFLGVNRHVGDTVYGMLMLVWRVVEGQKVKK